ncbi:TonB-dependent receptor [Flavihumibacter fluvii]|uniref:TonB-dependent receptor n=1 Tax=Flavihumibacter fluvii TaxID=2838157 RepID=UPI001BDECBDB|nr:TonB-dependent receptor [Flavihumibacter fluvii]ULQ53552.1 TonB-dependent receptor [Flavihumibacter fluvii]
MHNRFKVNLIIFFLLFHLPFRGYPQAVQTLRGQIIDQVLQKPVSGATVVVTAQNRTTTTDADGNFRFPNVPIGVHQIKVSHSAYKPSQLDNITINTGKEMVLTIALELNIVEQQEVVVKAKALRSKPLNDLSMVSARAFTVEETQRYAASVNDPSRMATSFAGVVSADDGNNNIVIRGNSPTGLLWRMEGIEIPNPNHFSAPGGSGGGISILSAQLLSTSDFITGAFAAEYSNALSGVFDLKLRKGNNEKREYTLQAGLLGLNLAAEGPLSKKHNGSYLVNYRYSTFSILNKIGMDVGEGTTNFQDLSYHICLPTNSAGSFALFGFWGKSGQEYSVDKDAGKWESEADRYGALYSGNVGITGLTHQVQLGEKTQLKSAVAWSVQQIGYDEQYAEKPDSLIINTREIFTTKKWTFSSTINHQFNRKNTIRAGLVVNEIGFEFNKDSREHTNEPLEERLAIKDHTQILQAFAQWQYKPNNHLSITGGINYLHLLLNNSSSIEPRMAMKWEINPKNSIGLGYGLHSQVQAMGVYFAKVNDNEGKWHQPNTELGLTKSNHFIFSYQHVLGKGMRLKTELYYQQLFNVPVSVFDSSSFSTLNIVQDIVTEPLVNKGRGKNYGLELSLERQLRNYWYFLFSNSIYQAKYMAADGTERNTRFNGNYASTLTAGKEFVHPGNRRSFGANIKVVYAGGFRETPIDIEGSTTNGYTKYIESEAFTLQLPAYFRTDIRLSMKWNKARHTSILSLDIQNTTNRKNIYTRYYDPLKGEIRTIYQTGIIPVINYSIEF